MREQGLDISEAQVLDGISAVTAGTNVLQFKTASADKYDTAATPDIGEAAPLYLVVKLDATMVGANIALEAKFVSKEADATITTGATEHMSLRFEPVAVAGEKHVAQLPAGTINRHVGILYRPTDTTDGTVGTLTTGTVSAYLSRSHETPTS